TAINSAGQVVGYVATEYTGSGITTKHACSWTPDGKVKDLGVLIGYTHSQATGINASGQIIGYSYRDDTVHSITLYRACLWNPDGSLLDLGVLPGDNISQALAINDAGQVVGRSRYFTDFKTPSLYRYHTFLWTRKRGMQDLGALAGTNVSDV